MMIYYYFKSAILVKYNYTTDASQNRTGHLIFFQEDN